MTKAEEMSKLARESLCEKYKIEIRAILNLVEDKASQGLNSCILNFIDFPEIENHDFRLWFIKEGFIFRRYNNKSIIIAW